MRHRSLLPLLLLLPTLVACGDEADGPAPEQLAARTSAARQACVADLLLQRADEELALLEQIPGSANVASFQRAYRQHAVLRNTVAAQLDSAFNHSATPADSSRHAAAAEGIRISSPDPETVEANVIRSYDENMGAILSDTDHPCNWRSELENPPAR